MRVRQPESGSRATKGGSLNEAIRYFARTYPLRSLATVLSLTAAAAVEGFGLAALVPMLALAISDGGGAPEEGTLNAMVHDLLGSVGIPFTLTGVASVVIGLIWVKAVVLMLANRQVGNTVAHVATDLRLKVLSSMLAARWSYYTHQPVGRITNAVATEANRAAESFYAVALGVQNLILAVLAVTVAALLSWQITLGAVAGGVFIGGMLHVLVRLATRAGWRHTNLVNSLLARLTDALINVRLLRATGRERLIGPMLGSDTQRLGQVLRTQVQLEELLKALQEPLVMMLLIVMLVYAHGTVGMPFERITVLVFAMTRALVAATKVQRRQQLAATHLSALESVRGLIESAEAAAENFAGTRQPTLDRGIELRQIDFAYDGNTVLEGLDLEIPTGEITALIGPSGGGKTTLIDLVTGLASPDGGTVEIDGVSLEDIDMRAWRAQIGYVPQEIILLHDSVRMNLTLGDTSISDARLKEVCEAAGIWDVVMAMEGGLEASVGERGTLLSGGQRSRIAIARALAPGPKLLILDEATAPLDPETEREVWKVMTDLRGQMTILAVSHQPALAAVADRIYRVEDGVANRIDDLPLASSN